jgi:hypothetical protein
MIGSISGNSGKKLAQLLRISKKERINFWEFRKKAGTVTENPRKRVASFSVPMIETHE